MATISLDIPGGERIYAIGDVHGRLDLFERLIAIIMQDNEARPPARVQIVLLGDLIDRGPASAELLARCRALAVRSDRFVVLKGNHEALMADALRGSFPALEMWLKHGGDAALRSWGVPADLIEDGPTVPLLAAARMLIDRETLEWIDTLPLTHLVGNCLFVHAGIRPGVKLAKQDPGDLLWIRREFTDNEDELPYRVVHGHSIDEATAEWRHGRIGIDSGAYRTGRLTAIGLEQGKDWMLATDPTIVLREARA